MPDPPMLLTRPGTLAEVQRLVRVDGEKLRFGLAGFLDLFYANHGPASRYARIIDDPGVNTMRKMAGGRPALQDQKSTASPAAAPRTGGGV
jgi:hypothetical protein